MAQFSGNMSGSGAYTAILDVNENAGQFTLSVRKNSGSGHWTYSPENWSVTIGPHTWSGTWTFDYRGNTIISMASGNFARPTLTSAWGASAYVAMGSTLGSATVGGTVTVPGTATAPPAPQMNAPDQITANSMRLTFSSRGDGGSPVTNWQLQYATNSAFTGATTIASNGNSTVTGLTPGTTYYARAQGKNAVGWGAFSNVVNAKTLSGAYISVNGQWKACEVYISTGSAWRVGEVNVSTGSAWKPAG